MSTLDNVTAFSRNDLSDYHSRLNRLNQLADKHGDQSKNMTKDENDLYEQLIEWFADVTD